jgi:hypothetical protein
MKRLISIFLTLDPVFFYSHPFFPAAPLSNSQPSVVSKEVTTRINHTIDYLIALGGLAAIIGLLGKNASLKVG